MQRNGKKDGVPFLHTSFVSPSERRFIEAEWAGKMSPSESMQVIENAQEDALYKKIIAQKLEVGGSVAIQKGSRRILESALVQSANLCRRESWKSPCPIAAVFQYVSLDNGKTWQEPIITTNAEIFELGRSTYEQSFIARPIRINGKAVKPYFPAPPR